MAKKNNSSAEEIDLTSFSWVTAGSNPEIGKPGCGGCHPGGGGLEFDRDGLRYDTRLRNNPGLSNTFDGDYYQSKWDRTGVIEADCLLCHLPGYSFKERNKNFDSLNYQWAIVAGSGIGMVMGTVKDGEVPKVLYNKRFFNDDGRIVFNLEAEPDSGNCRFCHDPADMIKRGFSWNDHSNHDIHNARNIECTSCHPGNREHQLAKGNENLSTVRDDLDNTIRTCKQCHDSGYMGATKPVHRNIRPNHLEKLACEVCHIPQLGRSSALGLDVSNGKVRLFPRNGAERVGGELIWFPDVTIGPDGKLHPVNAFKPNLFTNKGPDGIFVPLFAKEIAGAYETVHTQFIQEATAEPLINTTSEIEVMLQALAVTLRNNPRFKGVHPCYHSNGVIFQLNSAGELTLEEDFTWPSEPNNFNISHNVAPTQMALGSNGCADCHAERATIFSSWLAGRDAKETKLISAWFLAGDDSRVYYLNQLHKYNAAKRYLIPLLFTAVFTLIVFRENRLRETTVSAAAPLLPAGILPAVALLLLVRNISFLVLALTGILFFFNKINILQIAFVSPAAAITVHWSGGIVFVASILGCVAMHRRLFPHSKADICHFGISGGKVLIVLMALTGVGMIFRDHVPSEILYIISLVHTLAAFVLIAIYAAKFYYGISRKLYFLQRNDQRNSRF